MNTQNTSDSGHAKLLAAKERAGLSGAGGSAAPKASVHARPPFGGGGGRERSRTQRFPLLGPRAWARAQGARMAFAAAAAAARVARLVAYASPPHPGV